MITIRKLKYPRGCNTCRIDNATIDIEFRSCPEARGGIVVSLCDGCIEELKEALK